MSFWVFRATLVLSALALLAGPASAVPLTYNHTGGTASIDITVAGNAFNFNTSLAGTFVTYDSSTSQITDFLINTNDSNIVLPGAFAPFDELDLAISATPGVGYSSGPGVGSDVDLLDVDLNLTGLLDDTGILDLDLPFNFTLNLAGPLGVDVLIAGSTGTFTFQQMAWLHSGVDVTIDVTFIGQVVPEPGTLALLAFAAVGVVVRRRG